MSEKLLFDSEEIRLEHVREVWKVALETQMHFNDLLIKMRTTVISIILAVFSASAIIVRDIPAPVEIFHLTIHPSSIALLVGVVFLVCQYIIDRYYYLNLLLGAVDYTKKIDEYYQEKHPNENIFGLTASITKRIDERLAKRVLFFYYLIPIAIAIFVVCSIQIHIKNLVITPA